MNFLRTQEIMTLPEYMNDTLRRRVRRFVPPNELRDFFACGPIGFIIQVDEVVFDSALGGGGINVLIPFISGDRTTLVGIGFNQTGINGEPFTANKPGFDACADDALKHAAENVTVSEPLIACHVNAE